MLERESKALFNKSGNGGISGRVTIPIEWLRALNITKDNREILIQFDNDKIIIKKK